MSDKEATLEMPPHEHTVKLLEENDDLKVFMSFGLLSELTTLVPDVDSLGSMFVDPEMRGKLFESLLSKRNEKGEIESPANTWNTPMLPEDASLLLKWAHGHVAHYFIDALSSMNETAAALQGMMEKMISSLGTTEDSASETPPPLPSK